MRHLSTLFWFFNHVNLLPIKQHCAGVCACVCAYACVFKPSAYQKIKTSISLVVWHFLPSQARAWPGHGHLQKWRGLMDASLSMNPLLSHSLCYFSLFRMWWGGGRQEITGVKGSYKTSVFVVICVTNAQMKVIFITGQLLWVLQRQLTTLIFRLKFYDFYLGSYINDHSHESSFSLSEVSILWPISSKDLYSICLVILEKLSAFSLLNSGGSLQSVPLNWEFSVVLISLLPLSPKWELGTSFYSLNSKWHWSNLPRTVTEFSISTGGLRIPSHYLRSEVSTPLEKKENAQVSL